MSVRSKIAFAGAILLFLGIVFLKLTVGWLNLSSVLLAGAILCILLAVFFDRRLYLDFFSMRTTKHGMNMGALILLMLTFLTCVNYLANKYNRTFDFTQEKLNSLSEQSVKVLKSLRADLDIKVFVGSDPKVQDQKAQLKQLLKDYASRNSHVHFEFINAYQDQALAMKYLKDIADKDSPLVMFMEFQGKRFRVPAPFAEEQITGTLIKVTRQVEKKIYFVRGHGERDLDGESAAGLSEFKKALAEASYQTQTLSLIEKKEIPQDAAMVAIVGPSLPYLDSEINVLRDFIRKGGRVFLAIDPGQRHQLANLTRSFGVEFNNNVVIAVNPKIDQRGEWTVPAVQFDPQNEITQSIISGNTYVVMDTASSMRPAIDKEADLTIVDLVKTSPQSFTLADLKAGTTKNVKMETSTLGILVKGKGTLVVLGDSDFMSNKDFFLFSNRDLSLNSFAYLSNDMELISIRPKFPAGTILTVTTWTGLLFTIFGYGVPVLFIILGVTTWLRRRGA